MGGARIVLQEFRLPRQSQANGSIPLLLLTPRPQAREQTAWATLPARTFWCHTLSPELKVSRLHRESQRVGRSHCLSSKGKSKGLPFERSAVPIAKRCRGFVGALAKFE